MKSLHRHNKYFITTLLSLFLLTSCGQQSASQSDDFGSMEESAAEAPINWEVPAAFEFKALSDLIQAKNILSGYSEFKRFNANSVKIEPVVGFTDTGKPFTSPESCRESDAFITQRSYIINLASSASNYMMDGLTWHYGTKDSNDPRLFTITIVGDRNIGGEFLLDDIANELATCQSVTNDTSEWDWTTTQSFTQPTPDVLRVEYEMSFSGKGTSVRNGLWIARQVGRNVVYVAYTRDGLGTASDLPISSEIEDQMNLLLDAVALKLNS